MNRAIFIVRGVCLGVLALSTPVTRAFGESAVAFDTNYRWSLGTGPGVYGWQFSPQMNVSLTALGLFDNAGIFDGNYPGDGFLEAHDIGVWRITGSGTGALMASVTVPAGTAAPLSDGFRYVEISPVSLTGGLDYVIAALYPNPDYHLADWTVSSGVDSAFAASFSVDSNIQFEGRRYGGLHSTTLVYPANSQPAVMGDFGPNFMFTVVPEPTALALALFFGATVTLLRRRAFCR